MALLPIVWRVADAFLPADLRDDLAGADRLHRARFLVLGVLLLLPLTLFLTYQLFREDGLELLAWLLLVATVAASLCPLVLRVTGSQLLAGVIFCLCLITCLFAVILAGRGSAGAAAVWAVPLPLLAAFILGPRYGVLCGLLVAAGLLGIYWLEFTGQYVPPLTLASDLTRWLHLLAILSAVAVTTAVAWLYEGYSMQRPRDMDAELARLRLNLQKSEEEYKSLFDNIPTAVYRSTPGGQIIMANPALLRMLGVGTLAELREVNAATLYANPDGRRNLLRQLEEQEEVHGAEYDLVHRDGSPFTVRESAHVVRDPDGTVLYYEGIVEDITAQRRAEEAARRVAERARVLVQHSSDLITLLDVDGLIRYQSPSISRMLGYEADETLGVHVTEFVHEDDRRRIEVALRRAMRHPGGTGVLRFRCRHAHGHHVYVEAVGTNMLENPAMRGFVVNTRDVTDHKRAELALIRARDQAEEVARLKSAFLANMSHEIRTPLTGIIGFAGVLAEEVTDPEHREFVGLIERSGRRLVQTLNSVLDLARLEADQMEVELRRLDLIEHVREAAQLLQPLADEKRIRLVVEVPDEDVYARLDAGCLSRILNNLVGNALKFTDEGEVRVAVVKDDQRVHIHVSDTGIGIDPSFVPHLFDEFKQESTGLQRHHEGSGLGLTITRRLVELMHGSISVESEKGRGSRFTVTLPLVAPAQEPQIAPHELLKPSILVVDDNGSTLALMQHLLMPEANVDMATDEEQALSLVDQRPPGFYDLVFMDIHLGGTTSGTEIMLQIRSRPGYEGTPIIAFTAFALPGDRERFLNAGFSGYLSKPFTREQVARIVQQCCGLDRGDGSSARDAGGVTLSRGQRSGEASQVNLDSPDPEQAV